MIERRRAERAEQLKVARSWAERVAARLTIEAVVVVGSVARGDFNKWSDLDVLVVAEELPGDLRSRLELLMADSPPGLQPVGWTRDELARRRARGDPLAREAYEAGVVVHGELPR